MVSMVSMVCLAPTYAGKRENIRNRYSRFLTCEGLKTTMGNHGTMFLTHPTSRRQETPMTTYLECRLHAARLCQRLRDRDDRDSLEAAAMIEVTLEAFVSLLEQQDEARARLAEIVAIYGLAR
jgi:hypothetical protein